jgi:two-component system, cell cycle sensor histidine kinase and response regulator CckA
MIYLPHLTQPMTHFSSGIDPIEALRGTETILLVDDNEPFRKVVRAFLESSGYTVLDARTVSEAAQIASGHQGTINLLLTDVVMPEIDGYQLSDYLRFLCPEMSVLYMSGYGNSVSFAVAGSRVGAQVLPKPFCKNTLLLAVRRLLHLGEEQEAVIIPQRAWNGLSSLVPQLG